MFAYVYIPTIYLLYTGMYLHTPMIVLQYTQYIADIYLYMDLEVPTELQGYIPLYTTIYEFPGLLMQSKRSRSEMVRYKYELI